MTCEQFEQGFATALAHGRDPEADPQLKSHLANCPGCRASAAGLKDVWADLGKLPEPDAPWSLTHVADMIAAARPNVWRRRTRILGPALAAGVAGLLLGGVLMSGLRDSGLDTARIAELEAEVGQLRQLTEMVLGSPESPSSRLALIANVRHGADTAAARRLLHNLRTEDRVGARLAALIALESHNEDAAIANGLQEILQTEPSPHVQLAILRVLGFSPSSSASVGRFLERTDLDESVREEARAMLRTIRAEGTT